MPHDLAPSAAALPRRADARRSIERILDAAVEELSQGSASMGAVAARAGVARATLYAHFPTREALIEAVTERAIADSIETIRAAEPDRSDPAEALARVLSAAWRALGRYHGLVAITTSRLDHARQQALHEPVLGMLRALVERGQKSGAFNPDVPTDWLLTVLLELVHTASREMTGGRLSAKKAEQALLEAALGAVSNRTR
jgi:TetR/AcrR family transcriptional regulator, mexCD-oprJ operon repressor